MSIPLASESPSPLEGPTCRPLLLHTAGSAVPFFIRPRAGFKPGPSGGPPVPQADAGLALARWYVLARSRNCTDNTHFGPSSDDRADRIVMSKANGLYLGC